MSKNTVPPGWNQLNLNSLLPKLAGALFVAWLIFFGWSALHRLGWTSLQSYDEAWYASISRNLVRSGNILHTEFNEKLYIDHPPLGFWQIGLSQTVFGFTDFAARLPAALQGIGAVVLLYLIGRELHSQTSGILAGSALGSSLWFVMRTRSGNLDIPLLFWTLLSIYLGLTARKNWQYLLLGMSLAATLLVKTMIGGVVFPLLLLMVGLKIRPWPSKKQLGITFGSMGLLVAPWYLYMKIVNPEFWKHHFLAVGLRAGSNEVSGTTAIHQTLLYLRSGVGKWYWPALLSVPLAPVTWWLTKSRRAVVFALGWVVLVGTPFLLSSQTQIWHLLPLYPALFLLLGITVSTLVNESISSLKINLIKRLQPVATLGLLTAWLGLATFQLHNINQLTIPSSRNLAAEAEISIQASQIDPNYEVILMDIFWPEAVYYADRFVRDQGRNPEALKLLLAEDLTDKAIILPNESLGDFDNYEIEVLGENEKYVVIRLTRI